MISSVPPGAFGAETIGREAVFLSALRGGAMIWLRGTTAVDGVGVEEADVEPEEPAEATAGCGRAGKLPPRLGEDLPELPEGVEDEGDEGAEEDGAESAAAVEVGETAGEGGALAVSVFFGRGLRKVWGSFLGRSPSIKSRSL
jgi:hypothetical protein